MSSFETHPATFHESADENPSQDLSFPTKRAATVKLKTHKKKNCKAKNSSSPMEKDYLEMIHRALQKHQDRDAKEEQAMQAMTQDWVLALLMDWKDAGPYELEAALRYVCKDPQLVQLGNYYPRPSELE